MALDFPSNPIDGQIYNNYVWSAGTSAWKARPQAPSVTTQSPLAPASPNVGDIWINTNLGISFHYYDDGTSKQWVEMVSSAVPAVNTIMPSGTIVQTARATAPDYWLFCDGSAISRITYSTLYAAIGTQYGSGDGSTTFNLPNLQGRVPVGKDSGTFSALGATGGAESTSLNANHIPQHAHAIDHDHGAFTSGGGSSHRHWISSADRDDANMTTTGQNVQNYGLFADAGSYSADDPNRGTGRYTAYESGHTHSIDPPAFSGSSGNYGSATVTPVSALQPYVVLNYMIKV